MLKDKIKKIISSNMFNMLFIVLFNCANNLLTELSFPIIYSNIYYVIIDYNSSRNSKAIIYWLFFLALFCILSNIMQLFSKIIAQQTYPPLEKAIRIHLFDYSLRLPLQDVQRDGEGKLEAQNDALANGIMDALASLLERIIPYLLSILVFTIYIILEHFTIGIIHSLLTIVAGVIFFIINQPTLKISRSYNTIQNNRTSTISDIFKRMTTIKVFMLYGVLSQHMAKIFSNETNIYANYLKSDNWNIAILSLVYLVIDVIIFFLLYGALVSGKLKPLKILTILQFIISIKGIIADFIENIVELNETIGKMQESLTQLSAHDIESEQNKKKITDPVTSIRIKNFTYHTDTGIPIIKNLNLHLEGGVFLVIIGESGSGKSTIIYIMLGLIKIPSGHIFINGIDITLCDLHSLYKSIMYMGQGSTFFNESILQNMLFINPKISKQQLQKSFKKLKLDSLSNKICEKVGSDSSNLSGGQRTRLSWIRATNAGAKYKKSILFADEPTSGLDDQTSNIIVENIIEAVNSKNISIAIDHSKKLLPHANIVLHLTGGGRHRVLRCREMINRLV